MQTPSLVQQSMTGAVQASAGGGARRLLVGLIALLAALAILAGCGAAPSALGALFGPAVVPKPVSRHVRREPYSKPKPPPRVEVLPDKEPTDWAAMRDQLPKDDDGVVDWVKALDEKAITPKPGIKADAEDQDVLDKNVELVPKGKPDMKVTFRHKTHTAWLVCDNCHDAIFQPKKGADLITMKKIKAGEYCGVCHGKVAFDVDQGCSRCHPDS